MLQGFFQFRPSQRGWDFPALAGLCVGLPLLGGYFGGNMQGGSLGSLAGLVILYLHSDRLTERMLTLMACSFGIMLSFTVGALFSFNPYVAAAVLGLFSFVVHGALFYFRLTRPPGNFFFIMVASVAICQPFDLHSIPQRVGFVGIGTMLSCALGLGYSLLTLRRKGVSAPAARPRKSRRLHFSESLIFGLFTGLSLLLARLLHLQNPYWVPTSCAAIMQGLSSTQVLQRGLQRVGGTFVGLGLAWLVLLLQPSLLAICLAIIALQTVVEWLVVRHYGLAMVFITVLTIFLAESGNTALRAQPGPLMQARFLNIVLGSALGALGGWVLFHERLRGVSGEQSAVSSER